MDAESSEEPRAWNDNHPWLEYSCTLLDDENQISLGGKKILLRWAFQTEGFKADCGDERFFRGLAYDREGNFYGITEGDPNGGFSGARPIRTVVKKMEGKKALTWFVQHAAWDVPFARELCRAIDNPAFEFMPLVPTRSLPKKKRKARKNAEAFHEQLLMATALVEVMRKLDHEPTVENLSDACRSASALHQSLHSPENFKRATA